jgi:type IV fimbrial biogenesis protein FimT
MTSRSAMTRGFTVLELMVVLVILGIVTFIALPSYNRWIANTQVRTAAESIQNGMRLASLEAVRRNAQVDFVLTNDLSLTPASTPNAAGGSWVVRVPGATPELVDSKAAAEASRTVVVASLAGTVSFSGLGRLTTGSALACIRFTNPPNADRPLIVTVTPGGAVRMCDPTFGPTDPRGCQTTPPC